MLDTTTAEAPSQQPPSAPPETPSSAPLVESSKPEPVREPAAANEPAKAEGGEGPDWRLTLAGEDAKALETLARYKTPADFLKSHTELRAKLSERPQVARLADDATPEQIGEYRKALGLPEIGEGAKPDEFLKAFGIDAPTGAELTDLDTELLHGFAQQAYEQGHDPRSVKQAVSWYFEQAEAVRQATNESNAKLQKEWQADLREKYGREFDPTIETVNAYVRQSIPDEDLRAQIMQAQLPGGGRLGDHPAFVEMMLAGALSSGLTDRIEASSMESGGRSLAEQQREIEGWWHTDRARYDAKETRARLDKIINARLSRGEIDELGNEIKKRG